MKTYSSSHTQKVLLRKCYQEAPCHKNRHSKHQSKSARSGYNQAPRWCDLSNVGSDRASARRIQSDSLLQATACGEWTIPTIQQRSISANVSVRVSTADVYVRFASKILCIDSTHGTNAFKFKLLTAMVADDFAAGKIVCSCPVLVCIHVPSKMSAHMNNCYVQVQVIIQWNLCWKRFHCTCNKMLRFVFTY